MDRAEFSATDAHNVSPNAKRLRTSDDGASSSLRDAVTSSLQPEFTEVLQKRLAVLKERHAEHHQQNQDLPRPHQKFADKDISQLLIVEVFAGTARLSKVARNHGFRVLPVDHNQKLAQHIHLALFDLADDQQCSNLVDLFVKEQDHIVWVHFAPSGETASRAREKPLPAFVKQGIRVAKPLRSDDKPLGLDGLMGSDKVKCETANVVYENTCRLIFAAVKLGFTVSLENPVNSLFWLIPSVVSLLEQLQGFDTLFHNCCHGGKRKNYIRWWCTHDWFLRLRKPVILRTLMTPGPPELLTGSLCTRQLKKPHTPPYCVKD